MSAITFEWSPAAADTPTSDPVKAARPCSREEEFRLALDLYMADYVAHRSGHGETLEGAVGAQPVKRNLARDGGWRRFLTATGEIWAFSQELGTDWRQPRQLHSHPSQS